MKNNPPIEQIIESAPSKPRPALSPQVRSRLRKLQTRNFRSTTAIEERKGPKALIQEQIVPSQFQTLPSQISSIFESQIIEFVEVNNTNEPLTKINLIQPAAQSLERQSSQQPIIPSILPSEAPEIQRKSVFHKETILHRKKTQEQNADKVTLTKSETVNQAIKMTQVISNQMFSRDVNDLKKEEPEKDGTDYGAYFKNIIVFVVFIYAFIVVVISSFGKIGEKKIQTTGTEMKANLDFDLEVYPPQILLPFFWFVQLNKQAIVDRMDCLINKISENCFDMQEQKCRNQFEVKGKDYENCMMSTYKLYDKEQAQFCQRLYYESDTYYPTERETQLFKNNYYECLLAAGQPRGWQYCDETYGLGDAKDAEALYECYETYDVDKMLYVEDKCLAESPPTFEIEECSDDPTSVDTNGVSCTTHYESQENYKTCLVENGEYNIAKRFDCDKMNRTYDQYKYRSQCFDDQGIWQAQGVQTESDESDSYCSTTRGLINDRLQCYEEIDITPTHKLQEGCYKPGLRGQITKFQYEWIEKACIKQTHSFGLRFQNHSVEECAYMCDGSPECKSFIYGVDHCGDCSTTWTKPGTCWRHSDNDVTQCNSNSAAYKNLDVYIKIQHGQQAKALESYYQKSDGCQCHSSCASCNQFDAANPQYASLAVECLTCRSGEFYGVRGQKIGVICDKQLFEDHLLVWEERALEALDNYPNLINFTWPEEHVRSACRMGIPRQQNYYYDYQCITKCQTGPNEVGHCADGYEFQRSEPLGKGNQYVPNDENQDMCATICTPKEVDTELDQSYSNIDSLGHCETLLLAGDQKPSLESFIECYESYTLAENLPQMCGCEENGSKYCDFLACNFGNCHSCEDFETLEDCEVQDNNAAVRDCKFRCFNFFEPNFAKDEFYCGQFNNHVVINLTQLPERENLKVCNTFYPFSNEYVPIDERDRCLEYFGIEISKSEVYDKCRDKLDNLSDYENCHIMLGGKAKADSCWMASQGQSILDFEFSSWSKRNGLIIFDTKTFYPDCMTQYNQSVSAESCFQNFIIKDFSNDWYGGVKNCLEQFDLLISEEDKCFYDQYPDLIGQGSEPVLTAANIDCSLENLSDTKQQKCNECQEQTKSMEFGGLVMSALRQGRSVNDNLDSVITKNPHCQRKEGIFDEYENCMANVKSSTILSELNQKLKAKKQRLNEEFTPVESDTEYCQELFPTEDEIDSRIQCFVIIKKPLGPEHCLLLKRVKDHEAYEFNLFYKYLCLEQEDVLLDLDASYCLDRESIELKKFNEIEDCLNNYENSGRMPQLTQERSKFVFVRAEEDFNIILTEEEIEPIKVEVLIKGKTWGEINEKNLDDLAKCRCYAPTTKWGISICNSGPGDPDQVCNSSFGCDRRIGCDDNKYTCKPSELDGNTMTFEQCQHQCERVGMIIPTNEEELIPTVSTGCSADGAETFINQPIVNNHLEITLQLIEEFLCQNKTSLNFVSSPFQVMKGNQFYEMNQYDIELDCTIIEYSNLTTDNLMLYYRFSNETVPKKSNLDGNGGLDLYTDDFNTSRLIVNRTDQNQQYFEIDFSEDLDLIQVQSHQVFHYDRETAEVDAFQINTYEDYLRLTSNPQIQKMFETYPQIISQELMPNKIITAQSFMQIDEKANVTKKILGFLPFEYEDYTLNKINVQKISEPIKPTDREQLRREEKNQINKFQVSLEFDFTEVRVTQSFFTTLDIFSELGGLSASAGGILAKLGVVFLISYNLSLSQMIRRKYQHTLQLQEIKQYLKLLPEIAKIIRQKQSQCEIDTDKTQLQDDLSSLEVLKTQNYDHKYVLTRERHESFQGLLKRHMPQLLDSKALFEHSKKAYQHDKFELIEIDENEMKNELQKSKASMPLGEILLALKERISFFGVYNQVDRLDQSKLMVKKLKYQIKLERELREDLEKQFQKERQLREKQEQKFQNELQNVAGGLLKRIESLEKKKVD